MQKINTKQKILKIGRSLLQRFGYNGFSFQDIADKLEIRKPSLYDHYASKKELGVSIVRDYAESFDRWSDELGNLSPIHRIEKVFEVYYSFACDKNKICPISALAVDFQSLPKEVQREMRAFGARWVKWLELQIAEGQASGQIKKEKTPNELAKFVFNQGIGAQIQSRIQGSAEVVITAGQVTVDLIRTKNV